MDPYSRYTAWWRRRAREWRRVGSRIGNDDFVVSVLGGKRGGYFVEAGAMDGLGSSNTVRLERDHGWSGLCVEPDPGLFRLLRENRRCACENVCLYDTAGEVEFMADVPGWGGVVAHFSEWKRSRWASGRRIYVPAVPLATLLERHASPPLIDYLSLDTEGTEYLILKDFPFDRFRFRVVSVEGRSCSDLLAARGYRPVANPFNATAPWERYFLGGEESP